MLTLRRKETDKCNGRIRKNVFDCPRETNHITIGPHQPNTPQNPQGSCFPAAPLLLCRCFFGSPFLWCCAPRGGGDGWYFSCTFDFFEGRKSSKMVLSKMVPFCRSYYRPISSKSQQETINFNTILIQEVLNLKTTFQQLYINFISTLG